MQTGMDRFINPRSSTRDSTGNYQQQQLFDNNPHFLPPQMDSLDQQQQQRFVPYQMESNRFREGSPPPNQSSSNNADSSVFNIEGLSSPSWNCERLFNLLCLYGNVSRVRERGSDFP